MQKLLILGAKNKIMKTIFLIIILCFVAQAQDLKIINTNYCNDNLIVTADTSGYRNPKVTYRFNNVTYESSVLSIARQDIQDSMKIEYTIEYDSYEKDRKGRIKCIKTCKLVRIVNLSASKCTPQYRCVSLDDVDDISYSGIYSEDSVINLKTNLLKDDIFGKIIYQWKTNYGNISYKDNEASINFTDMSSIPDMLTVTLSVSNNEDKCNVAKTLLLYKPLPKLPKIKIVEGECIFKTDRVDNVCKSVVHNYLRGMQANPNLKLILRGNYKQSWLLKNTIISGATGIKIDANRIIILDGNELKGIVKIRYDL